MWLVAVLVLAAAPDAGVLPDIPSPFGHIGGTVEPVPAGGVRDADGPVLLGQPGCAPQVAYLVRYVGGTLRAVEQLQQWLDRTGLEGKLFKRKGVLAEVVRRVSDARLGDKQLCSPAAREGFKLTLETAPKSLCAAPASRSGGDFWFLAGDAPAAVVSVLEGAPDACLPRLSAVLFDARGVARVRLHADWGGAISANLLGDSCQSVDFTFNEGKQAFVPSRKTCKR